MSTNEESPPRDLELPKTISSHLEDTGSGVETATVLPDKTMKDAPDRPNEPPRLSDRSMGVHSPFKAHEVLTSPPDAENNALPPSSPFQSFIEANEPNEDDTLPLQETTEESPVTIKAEVGNDQPDKAPEKRGRASKTPQPDTLPLPHVAPMSEPKPPRVDKDKAEKKRTRASESDVVLPRRQAASSASFSPLNDKVLNENAKNSSRLSKTPEPDVVIRHHSIPMSEPKPVRTSKAANMAGGMTDLISASSLHEIGAKETSPAVPSQTPQSDTAPHRQPVPASEPKPARISKAKVKPTRVSESHRYYSTPRSRPKVPVRCKDRILVTD